MLQLLIIKQLVIRHLTRNQGLSVGIISAHAQSNLRLKALTCCSMQRSRRVFFLYFFIVVCMYLTAERSVNKCTLNFQAKHIIQGIDSGITQYQSFFLLCF